MADFRDTGTVADNREAFTMLVNAGRSTSSDDLSTCVGTGSRIQVFELPPVMIFFNSSCDVGAKTLRTGGGWSRKSESLL